MLDDLDAGLLRMHASSGRPDLATQLGGRDPVFVLPPDFRTIGYITNAIESLTASYARQLATRGDFPPIRAPPNSSGCPFVNHGRLEETTDRTARRQGAIHHAAR